MVNNIFKKDKNSVVLFVIIGMILISAIIGVTIYSNSKKPNNSQVSEESTTPEITSQAVVEIPEDDPYSLEPEDDLITSANIGDYTETIIEGSDLEYLLSTMDDTYAYFISSESINRLESIDVKDYVATAYEEIDGVYAPRDTIDSATKGKHYQIFLNVGRTVDGLTSIRWDPIEGAYYSSGTLRLADVAKILVDPKTNERYKDVYIKMFIPWDHRHAFQPEDKFCVRKLFTTSDDSLLGYVFEQTSLKFVGEEETADDSITEPEAQQDVQPEVDQDMPSHAIQVSPQ